MLFEEESDTRLRFQWDVSFSEALAPATPGAGILLSSG